MYRLLPSKRLLFFLVPLLLARAGALADTVLVLPFFNESKSQNLDWISESLAETTREVLATEGVLVLDRDDRQEAYRRTLLRPGARLTRASVIKLGEALDAALVIYGRFDVKENGDPPKRWLRIFANVLVLRNLRQGPEFTEQGALEDLANLQTHLAWQSLQFLAPEAAPSEQEFRKQRPSVRLDAVENYIRGLLAASPEQQHRLFAQAARLDENYSQPCFALGRLNWGKRDYSAAASWLERVKPSDPHYREAVFLLGLCRYFIGEFAGAASAFRLVAEAVPLNEVYNNLGAALSRQNSLQGLENFRKALEGDEADPDYHFNVGYALWKRGDYSNAAQSFRAVLERDPDDSEATLMLGRCLQRNGPRPGDPRSDGLERVKENYEESAYRQLKAALGGKRP